MLTLSTFGIVYLWPVPGIKEQIAPARTVYLSRFR